MDPNKCLAEIRELRLAIYISQTSKERAQLAVELADKIRDLDRWISSGGFLPTYWAKPNNAPCQD